MLSLRNPASAFHDHQPIDCSKTSLMQGLISGVKVAACKTVRALSWTSNRTGVRRVLLHFAFQASYNLRPRAQP
jgi:hypothetical protein